MILLHAFLTQFNLVGVLLFLNTIPRYAFHFVGIITIISDIFRYKFHKIAFHTSLRQETIRKSKYFFTFTAVFSMYAIP